VYERAIEITPSDSADLEINVKAIYVGATGTMRVRFHSGHIVTFTALLAGTIYPMHVSRVFATGTDATGLIGLSNR
jgi:hypothetical protein